ncbi:unnamed protein product [Boreogadus saida]
MAGEQCWQTYSHNKLIEFRISLESLLTRRGGAEGSCPGVLTGPGVRAVRTELRQLPDDSGALACDANSPPPPPTHQAARGGKPDRAASVPDVGTPATLRAGSILNGLHAAVGNSGSGKQRLPPPCFPPSRCAELI